jgi:hypothetical protein
VPRREKGINIAKFSLLPSEGWEKVAEGRMRACFNIGTRGEMPSSALWAPSPIALRREKGISIAKFSLLPSEGRMRVLSHCTSVHFPFVFPLLVG